MTDGEKAGEIEDLLLDDDGAVRYLDVDLETVQKHILVPTDRARVDEAENVVWVPGLSLAQIEEFPSYDHDPESMTEEHQNRIASAYAEAAEPRRPEFSYPVRQSRPAPGKPVWSGPLLALAEAGNYDVVAGDADPRGWDLVMADRRREGTVHDLLIDPAAMKVRYLDCELTAPEHGHPAGGRHILVPIGYTRLDTHEKTVYVDAIDSARVSDLPSFPGLPVAPEDEERIFEIFAHGANGYRGGDWERG